MYFYGRFCKRTWTLFNEQAWDNRPKFCVWAVDPLSFNPVSCHSVSMRGRVSRLGASRRETWQPGPACGLGPRSHSSLRPRAELRLRHNWDSEIEREQKYKSRVLSRSDYNLCSPHFGKYWGAGARTGANICLSRLCLGLCWQSLINIAIWRFWEIQEMEQGIKLNIWILKIKKKFLSLLSGFEILWSFTFQLWSSN